LGVDLAGTSLVNDFKTKQKGKMGAEISRHIRETSVKRDPWE